MVYFHLLTCFKQNFLSSWLKSGLFPSDGIEKRSLSTWYIFKSGVSLLDNLLKAVFVHLMACKKISCTPCKNGLRLTDDLCNGVFFHLKTCYLKNGLCPLEEKERRLNPTKKIEEWSSATSWNSKMVFVNLMACEKPFCPPDVLQKKVSLYMCWFCSLLLPLNERGWKPITI